MRLKLMTRKNHLNMGREGRRIDKVSRFYVAGAVFSGNVHHNTSYVIDGYGVSVYHHSDGHRVHHAHGHRSSSGHGQKMEEEDHEGISLYAQ